MVSVKNIRKKAVAVTLAAVLAGTTLVAQAAAVRPANDPYLSWLATAYNGGSAHYGWNTTTNQLTNLPAVANLKVAAPGGQAPFAAMVGGANHIVADSQADWDTTQNGTNFLITAFPSIAHSTTTDVWTGSGHGKFDTSTNATTGNENGWTIMQNAGVNVVLDKPEQHSADWYPNTEVDDYLDPNDVTVVPAGPMATPSAIKTAAQILADVFGDPSSHLTTFDSDYDSYLSAAHTIAANYYSTHTQKKKVLYIHGVNTTAGTVRLMSSPPANGSNDYDGYILSDYISSSSYLESDNITDDWISAQGLAQGEDGNLYVSYADFNTIISTYQPDVVIFNTSGNESTIDNTVLTGTAKTWYDANIYYSGSTRYSAAPIGIYNEALRSPDTALAPAWLAYAIFRSDVSGNYTLSTLKSQATTFYSDVYGFSISSSQLSTMFSHLN
ncbi:MAG: hypothetical protein ABF449_05490 [Ethanoligenens sp.]